MTSSEFFSSILVALPFVFVCALSDRILLSSRSDQHSATNHIPQPLKGHVDHLTNTPAVGNVQLPAFCVSFAVAAATLVFCALFGMIQNIASPSDHGNLSPKSSQKRASHTGWAIALHIRKAVKKVSTVALPFYAASTLGGARVVLIILVALFSKLMTLEDGGTALTDIKGWKQLLKYRPWTLSSILAQALFDYLNYTNPVGKEAYATGYLALTISIFALPPPFPSTIRGVSSHGDSTSPTSGSVVLSSGFETPSIPEVASLKKSTVSPLISSTNEINNTLQAGIVSAVLCWLLFLLSEIGATPLQLSTVGWFFLTSCTASACLLLAQPKSLQENKGLGTLTGAITSSAIAYLFDPDIWRLLVFQGMLISLSLLATQMDTPTVFPSKSEANQSRGAVHHHTASGHVHSDEHSRLTKLLLEAFQHRPLLHSILVEKDSRRIFYFMRFVACATHADDVVLTISQPQFRLHACTAILWHRDRLPGPPQRQHPHVL